MSQSKTHDVIIVGGGPVGVGLAIELGQRGITCALIERYEQPQPIPKGQNLTQRTMEHMQVWGVEAELRAARTIPKEYGIGGLTAYGTLLGHYSYDWMQREIVRPFYAADNERLPQFATEAVLRRRLAEIDTVESFYGWTAEEVTQEDAGVKVSIRARADGVQQTLTAAYGVGCDGSRSLVRTSAGITQTLSDHDRVMVLLVFRSTELNDKLRRYPGKSYFNVLHPDLKGYWKFFGRVDLDGTFFFHAPVPVGTTKDNFDFTTLLHEAAGAEFDVAFKHIGFWDLRIATADSYGNGRLFVAGDAAHSHPPYGGYGINTGFEDARNLGWKLAARLQGWGGDGLLASYDAERRPVFQSTARDFIEKAIDADRRFLAAFDPAKDSATFEAEWHARSSGARAEVNAFEPHYEGSPIVFGAPGSSCSAVGSHSFVARPGHHLAPHTLSSGKSVFDELSRGFTLLDFGEDDAERRIFKMGAFEQSMALTPIIDTGPAGRERYGANYVIVRPDHFVAWAGDVATYSDKDIFRRITGN